MMDAKKFGMFIATLRKEKNMTQVDLAKKLQVTDKAVSKWERGRGYPNIDSLKAISKYFSVSLDELLSCDAILTIAEEENTQKEMHFRNLVFGLLDCSVAIFLFLPFFGQRVDGVIQEVSLLSLTEMETYIKIPYFMVVFAMILWGILILALQNCKSTLWLRSKDKVSLGLSAIGALLFMISLQPYAAMFTFIFLLIKAQMLIKWA